MAVAAAVRWGRIGGLLVAALLCCELTCQLFFYLWAGERFRSLQPMVWSPYGLVRNNPELTSPEFKHDRAGFRDRREYERVKPPNTLRVLLLGASVLYSAVTPPHHGLVSTAARTGSGDTIAQHLEAALRGRPELAGLGIEVINAGVSFNRYPEMASAYLSEYVFWDADVVVVLGSYNNVSHDPPYRGYYDEQTGRMMRPHPYRLEFERAVNGKSLVSLVEKAFVVLADHSAFVALTRKGTSKAIDGLLARSRAWGERLFPARPAPPRPLADEAEVRRFVRGLLGYVGGMLESARIHDQHMAFFWEYAKVDVLALRRLPAGTDPHAAYGELRLDVSPDEAYLRAMFHYQRQMKRYVEAAGGTFVDPLVPFLQDPEAIYVDYLHYTPAGNEVAAQSMLERLLPVLQERARRLRSGDKLPLADSAAPVPAAPLAPEPAAREPAPAAPAAPADALDPGQPPTAAP